MFKKLSLNQWRLNKLNKVLKQVNDLQEEMRGYSDHQLQAQTIKLKKLIKQGSTLDQLLPQAFATIREAAYRVLGMFPYDEQVLGGIVMHQGNIAEMLTGEGKTLTAIMPLYLNALTGKGAMLVTANDYLTVRDGEEMGAVFKWLGLTVAIGVKRSSRDPDFTPKQKRAIYQSDIVYTTYGTLGFDYLIENLASEPSKQFLRPFNYVVIDEIDSVLLDSAQMPLIISGAPRVQSNLYKLTNQFIELVDDNDFEMSEEEDQVWFTDQGISKIEKFFNIKNLYEASNYELNRHLLLALKAHKLFHLNKHYIIRKDEIYLLDQTSGRALSGTKLQAGQHQAIESKEQLEISEEKRAMASITYQNLFRKFNKMSGMSGTVKVAEAEFNEIYGMDVIVIPTHKPVQRKDLADRIYPDLESKIRASMRLIIDEHHKGRPILIAVGTVNMSKIYSNLLLNEGIAHNVLNAYHAAKEAEMIKRAGQKYAVTIATPMAGRGTDIKLSPGVAELGGLLVIGTEKMPSKRTDLQLRGRAGRQGDPGESIFFASFEDELIRRWGLDLEAKHSSVFKNKKLFRKSQLQKRIDLAQEASDSFSKERRQQALYLDESLSFQRDYIYQQRDLFLDENYRISLDYLVEIANVYLDDFIKEYQIDSYTLMRFIAEHLSYQQQKIPETILNIDSNDLKKFLLGLFVQELNRKKTLLNDETSFQAFMRKAILKAIDEGWIEQVDYLQQFKQVVGMRQLAQRNIYLEYHKEALEAYNKMQRLIYKKIIQFLCLSNIEYNEDNEAVVIFT
ncbi:accessory Sec system translocase SecA2 [Facklamia sp. 7083-14-GEN3]|uniref:accessory Sec system translocase SecA2 n=1 Tax=Facklamia sp. 7083-14-GEN3 TaxID=2973478 RepID=UPI00215B82B2|nr:accessory Sec system translocase SecA2 [Facklamia sp. 7083-14-GEN3]MCR8968377.1 accessory Sec system translocase SecA2 [Facklamia sp. 7083-14-GEN3]